MTTLEPARRAADGLAAARPADAVTRHYRREVRSMARIARGMGATNWLVRTAATDYFLKQYPPDADVAGEAAALKLSREARAAGVPAPMVILSAAGELLWTNGDLALALFEYFPDTTSGVALSRPEMAQAGHTLGRLHACLRGRPGLGDTAAAWLALDARRKQAAFERYFPAIGQREEQDEFDRRTAPLLHRRLELLPRSASLLGSLPPLARQVVHGDYSLWNVLFRKGELIAVVDFRPPELFLPAFEIGRAALAPEMVTAGPEWLDEALAFVAACCRANPDIGRSDVRFAPHVWAIQLVRSEYGVRQHYFGPSTGRPVSTGSGSNGARLPTGSSIASTSCRSSSIRSGSAVGMTPGPPCLRRTKSKRRRQGRRGGATDADLRRRPETGDAQSADATRVGTSRERRGSVTRRW